MPTVPNLKPIIKVSEKQIKQLVRRLMSDKGAIKPTAIRNPNLGSEIATARTELVTPQSTFKSFPEGPQTEVLPELPFRESNMVPNPYAQMEMPEVLPPRRITRQRVGTGFEPPNRSDLIMNRVSNQIQGSSAMDKLGQYAEPAEVSMGRLYRDVDDIREIKDLPLEEARALLKQDSSYFPVNRPNISPVTRLRSTSKEEANLGEGYEKGLAFERLKWKPVETLSDRVVQATVAAAAKESGIKITKEETRTLADTFGDMWRGLAGRGRGSEEAQLWDMYRKGAVGQKRISNIEGASAKTYFIRSAQMFKNNPTEFMRKFPREAKRLNENWDLYMNGAKSKGTKHIHYEGRQPEKINTEGFVNE